MLERRMQALIAGDGAPAQALPGASWTLIRDRRIVHSGAVGYADPNTRRRHLRADTPMRVASISKVSTTLTLMMLVDRGRLSLDADAGDLLGFQLRNPAFPDTPIRVRHLLSHTSSMRDGDVYWGALGEKLADFFTPGAAHWENGAHWDAAHPPGAYFTYCNLAFGVIATIIEKLEQQRFDLVVHERLFGPLGLPCGFNWSECEPGFIARHSAIWQRTGETWEAQVDETPALDRPAFLNPNNLPLSSYHIGENGLLFSPQGGLRASAHDLAQIACLLLRRGAPLVSNTAITAMQSVAWRYDGANADTQNNFWRAYGLGQQIIEPGESSPIPNQRRALVGHSGDAYGLKGGLWVDQETGSGFTFLLNGGPQDADRAHGAHSGFTLAEETAMQVLYEAIES